MDLSFFKIFLLLFCTFVSASKRPHDDSIEVPSKHQKLDEKADICGICDNKGVCHSETTTKLIRTCRCGQIVHRGCLIEWFKKNQTLDAVAPKKQAWKILSSSRTVKVSGVASLPLNNTVPPVKGIQLGSQQLIKADGQGIKQFLYDNKVCFFQPFRQ